MILTRFYRRLSDILYLIPTHTAYLWLVCLFFSKTLLPPLPRILHRHPTRLSCQPAIMWMPEQQCRLQIHVRHLLVYVLKLRAISTLSSLWQLLLSLWLLVSLRLLVRVIVLCHRWNATLCSCEARSDYTWTRHWSLRVPVAEWQHFECVFCANFQAYDYIHQSVLLSTFSPMSSYNWLGITGFVAMFSFCRVELTTI